MLKVLSSRLLSRSCKLLPMSTRSLCAGIEGSDGFASNFAVLPVMHDIEKSRFYIKLDETNEAVLSYERKRNLIDMFETEVPMDWQGKGVAGQLAKTALEYAVANNIPMRLTCTYLQNYYKDNIKKEYQKLYVATLESLVVAHDKGSRFYIKLDEESEAVLSYEIKENIMNMYSTEVPESYQGRGIAGLLAKTAFSYATENNFSFKLTCTYLQNYFRDNIKNNKCNRLVVMS